MHTQEFIAIGCYFIILFAIGFFSYRKHLTSSDFIIGSRSMNYWLTALAAHASDMGTWLFLGYPAIVFSQGVFASWTAIGLILFMFLNWQLVAPKIRVATEQYNSLTFSSFFESRFADTSGMIRVFTALMSILFYTIYISAGLVGLGLLLETLFNFSYEWSVLAGVLIIIPYVFIGGYLTLAWIDLFQGLFLMGVIVFVPLFVSEALGGWKEVSSALTSHHLQLSLFPDFSSKTFFEILGMATGWGLGYFGQPHIVTKFMGIRNVHEIGKSKWIGMSWMVLSLSAAILVGLVGVAFFPQGLENPELLFINMVKSSFPPFLIGLILCAVLAATINAMSSQVLVLSSNITEDLYKHLFRKNASSRELLFVARSGVIVVACIAFFIAYGRFSSIYSLVFYAWSGIGASFGPLILLSLYWKGMNKYGAWAGILSGGSIAAIWPYFSTPIPSMIPGFVGGLLCILGVSLLTQPSVKTK